MIAIYKCPNCGAPAGGVHPDEDIVTMEMECETCGHKMTIEDFSQMAAQPFMPGGALNQKPTTPPNPHNRTILFDGQSKFIFQIGGHKFRVSLESLIRLVTDAKLAIDEAGIQP